MVLVDTSVWVLVFRRFDPLDLETIVDWDEVVTCLPVIQEVLQGMREEKPYRLAREAMFSLPMVESPLGRDLFEEAVDLYRRARHAGVTVRSSVDCLIAACAVRSSLTVLHDDRDYHHLARVSALSERRAR